VRHTLTSLLLAAVAAVLAGAQSLTAVGEWVADAPPQVLAALGIRHDPLTGRFQPPAEATIRRALEAVDAAALDKAVGSWLASTAERNLSQLTALVKTRRRRMQYRPGLPDGFLASAGLDLTPLCNPPLEIF
jgi:DDE_Tnp_1-associated